MIPYNQEKIENAICFFALEHKKATKQYLFQTFLYKYLALLDFKSFKDIGNSVLGLEYKAMKWGPVPEEIYSKRGNYKTEKFEFISQEENQIVVVPKDIPDLLYFSPYEIDEMKRLIHIYANRFVKTKLISDTTHEEIIAWQKTWNKNPNALIKYELTFEDGFKNKIEEELSTAEEHHLIHKAMENL